MSHSAKSCAISKFWRDVRQGVRVRNWLANSNERNAAARPPALARREPPQGTSAALRPSPRACHWPSSRALPWFLGEALMAYEFTEWDTRELKYE